MRIIVFFLLFLPFVTSAQNDYDMDELAINTPASTTGSVEQLAAYFLKNIREERGRVRAIFAWITMNIRYLDTSNQSELWATPEHLDRQRPEQVLKNRTAVCQGFANLFQALANACGMKSAVVTGIVKNEDGEVMRIGHAWVAVEILGEWRLFDPTWSLPPPGARWGVIDKYFMMPPAKFVLNHLPDDPAWQLLINPVKETEFRENDAESLLDLLQHEPDQVFDFRDTLKNWIALDSVSRIFSAENRILQFNGDNPPVLFSLGQSYWGAFFDLRANLDSLADRSIIQDSIPIDTLYFSARLELMGKYYQRATELFHRITEPRRAAQTSKFYRAEEVYAIIAKLRGAMYTALFENVFTETSQDINQGSLEQLAAVSEAADASYRDAIQNVDCQKMEGTCFEILHNLSLAHLQLGERYAQFSQNMLQDQNALKYRVLTDYANKSAKKLLQLADSEVRQLALIPPPYAFVRERQLRIRQDLLSLQLSEIRARRVAFSTPIEAALAPSNHNKHAAKNIIGQFQPLVEDLNDLSQTVEDSYSELGAEFCEITLFNIQQEAFAMQFNLASLYFRAGLDMYQSAVEQNSLSSERENIQKEAQKALPWLRESRNALDFLEKSKRANKSYIEQRKIQIGKLSKSVNGFLDTL